MSTRFQLVIDCADPVRQTAFWAGALGYVLEPAPAGHATWKAYYRSLGVPENELEEMADDDVDSIVDPDGVGPRIWFQPVPEGKVVKTGCIWTSRSLIERRHSRRVGSRSTARSSG
jgi:Glyoxalase-like domain